ncbi:hypothetical protein AVEN_205930-1 [Araneus ventricosus]|uniref:Uncharacterized protein n=1 Tax=Araneus ventricosus TaxID=182803 RepID=A0A4Y2RN17_ARAVE|nr:hypothetical protein AVEN_205930-1 [Araneus ventricosus]
MEKESNLLLMKTFFSDLTKWIKLDGEDFHHFRELNTSLGGKAANKELHVAKETCLNDGRVFQRYWKIRPSICSKPKPYLVEAFRWFNLMGRREAAPPSTRAQVVTCRRRRSRSRLYLHNPTVELVENKRPRSPERSISTLSLQPRSDLSNYNSL